MIRNRTTVVDSTNETLRLHPYDKTSYFCDCSIEDIEPLEDEKAKLLLSFKSHGERYKFFMNSTVDTGKKMTIGSNVYVKVRLPSGGTQELRGIIRYKGPLPKEDGTVFGVELLVSQHRCRVEFESVYHLGCCGIEKKPDIDISKKNTDIIDISIIFDIFLLFIKLRNPNAYITY